jgi:uncharacterized protein (TIGR00369 family)
MKEWKPLDPAYATTVRRAFDRQTAMRTLGAELAFLAPGAVDIALPCHDGVMSHVPPVVHGGVVGMIADSAMGFAALSLAPAGTSGLTVEYKINFLAPAAGDRLVARGRVTRPGSKLTFAEVDVVAVAGGGERTVASATGTFIPVAGL